MEAGSEKSHALGFVPFLFKHTMGQLLSECLATDISAGRETFYRTTDENNHITGVLRGYSRCFFIWNLQRPDDHKKRQSIYTKNHRTYFISYHGSVSFSTVSYTHLRAHETDSYLVC